jgi:hypothetical protein
MQQHLYQWTFITRDMAQTLVVGGVENGVTKSPPNIRAIYF